MFLPKEEITGERSSEDIWITVENMGYESAIPQPLSFPQQTYSHTMLEAVRDLKVLLIGDGIIDEYVYVTPLGKSTKDTMISVKYNRKETFRGGVWATAEHVRQFCDKVDVLIGPSLTTNRRFIEEAYMRKLFIVHESKQIESINPGWKAEDYDLVIINDFGHGCEVVTQDYLSAKFVAVNTQTNTSNYGFNVITKYPTAGFVVIDELEARLAVHDRTSPLEKVVAKLPFQKIIVTQGYNGATGWDGHETYHLPASTKNVVDTMGAGDAFLAISSLFAAKGFPISDLVKVGNAAGAAKVGIVGHSQPVTPELVRKYL